MRKTSAFPLLKSFEENPAWVLAGALTALGVALLWAFPQPIRVDQRVVLWSFSFRHYPNFDDAIGSTLIAGLLNRLAAANPSVLNEQMRSFALMAYVGGAWALGSFVLKDRFLQCVFLLLLFLSRMPFLWLSSELLGGAFLCFGLAAILRRWSSWLVSFFLTGFALMKPDMALTAGVLGLAALWEAHSRSPKSREFQRLIAGFAVFGLTFVGPSLWVNGAHFTQGRGFEAFVQHYADLVFRHQILRNAPDPWNFSREYTNAVFPLAHSYAGLLRQYPSQYVDFVFLSLAKGFKNAIRLFQLLLVLGGLRLAFYWSKGRILGLSDRAERWMALSFVGMVPLVLLSFPHVRYMARYTPLVLLLLLGFVERLREDKSRHSQAWLRASYVALAVAFVAQLGIFAHDIARLGEPTRLFFWFPD